MYRILARLARGPGLLFGRRGISLMPGGIKGGLGRIRVMVGFGRRSPVWATPCRTNDVCKTKRMVKNFSHIFLFQERNERKVCVRGVRITPIYNKKNTLYA